VIWLCAPVAVKVWAQYTPIFVALRAAELGNHGISPVLLALMLRGDLRKDRTSH